MRALVVVAVLLAGCNSLPDTPIGNYTGWGKCQPGQCAPSQELTTYRCGLGATEVIVRGAKNPDPQTCKPLERI